MKAKTKRVVTAMLAVVMLLTTLLPLTASAADVTMDLNNCHVSWDYTLTDEDGNTFSAAYGLRAADDIYFNKGFSPYLSRMHDYTASLNAETNPIGYTARTMSIASALSEASRCRTIRNMPAPPMQATEINISG